MNMKALLIGNTGENGELEGVNQDLINYKNFLKSVNGGSWNDKDIIVSKDENIYEIRNKISELRNKYNFIFTLFTGHGTYDFENKCRKLYIFDDYILENDLINLSRKQITILDSCANIEYLPKILLESSLENEAKIIKKLLNRMKYEELISKCEYQQVILYSCEIDESSKDNSELGGLFAYNLLEAAYHSKKDLTSKEAYLIAKKEVSKLTNNEQNPCSNCIKSTTLPFSIF